MHLIEVQPGLLVEEAGKLYEVSAKFDETMGYTHIDDRLSQCPSQVVHRQRLLRGILLLLLNDGRDDLG